MHKSLIGVTGALALLTGCNQSPDSDQTLAGSNAAGKAPSAAVENAVHNRMGGPLQKKQALALMKQRHDNFEKIGDAMKVIGRELKTERPNLAQVRQGADTIARLAPKVKTWFPEGTGPDAGKTDARAEIWQKPEDFAAKARAFEQAAIAFRRASRGNDLAAIRTAQANLGKSCKGCHDLYREDDD